MLYTDKTTVQDVLAAWDSGDSVWSVEMGGLGPGYEQAIQVGVIELLRDNVGKPLPKRDDRDEWRKWGDETIKRIDHTVGGFSGAQWGAARNVAYRMLRDGPKACIDSVPDPDRKILVSRTWPHASVPESH
jgi:hypothetical protein